MYLSLILSLTAFFVHQSLGLPLPGMQTVYETHFVTVRPTVIESGGSLSTIAPSKTSGASNAATETSPSTTSVPTSQSSSQQTLQSSLASSTQQDSATSSSSQPSSSSLGSSGEFKGQGTYYNPGMGACGKTSTENDHIVAVSKQLYEQKNKNGNSNNNPLCGKNIKVNYKGKSVTVKVVDSCPGCKIHDLDLSPSAFSQIADKSLGRIDITWTWE